MPENQAISGGKFGLVTAWLEKEELTAVGAAGVPATEIIEDWEAGRVSLRPPPG